MSGDHSPGLMRAAVESILSCLASVDAERQRRLADKTLGQRVQAIKRFQQQRFQFTYADLLDSPRYAAAARFFLDELYGPTDFSQRDAQFARVVPTVAKLFPADVLRIVATLARLHALSESLDSLMATSMASDTLDPRSYLDAWVRAGHADERALQLDLTLEVAAELEGLTAKPLLQGTLRLMRRPARASGLGQLQAFLESGFDAFRAMRGSAEFSRTIEARERALAAALFACEPNEASASRVAAALAVLPRGDHQ